MATLWREPRAAHAWIEERRAAGASTEHIVEEIARSEDPDGLIRAAYLALHTRNLELARTLLRRARAQSSDEWTHRLAIAVHGLTLVTQGRLSGVSTVTGAAALRPLIERLLDEVRSSAGRGEYGLEVEYRLLHALGAIAQQMGDEAAAIEAASRALELAYILDIRALIDPAALLYAAALALGGRYREAFGVRENLSKETRLLPVQLVANETQAAVLLAALGDGEEASRRLRTTVASLGGAYERAVLQALEAQLGRGGAQGALVRGHGVEGLYVWRTEALRRMMSFTASPPWRSGDDERAKLMREALEFANVSVEDAWTHNSRVRAAWIRAWCHLHLGETGLTELELSRAERPLPEDLDLRALLAGVKLDLALSMRGRPVEPIVVTEGEVRQVFDRARRFSRGAALGLARLLRRWHPLASAYATLMPEGVPELRDALDGVMRIGPSTTAYGVTLPPMYVAEQVLRSCGLPIEAPALNTAMRRQLEPLRLQDGEVEVWRPVLSALSLAYGLLIGEGVGEERRARARSIVLDFGALPTLRATYASRELASVSAAFDRLVNGSVNAAEFVRTLQALS